MLLVVFSIHSASDVSYIRTTVSVTYFLSQSNMLYFLFLCSCYCSVSMAAKTQTKIMDFIFCSVSNKMILLFVVKSDIFNKLLTFLLYCTTVHLYYCHTIQQQLQLQGSLLYLFCFKLFNLC